MLDQTDRPENTHHTQTVDDVERGDDNNVGEAIANIVADESAENVSQQIPSKQTHDVDEDAEDETDWQRHDADEVDETRSDIDSMSSCSSSDADELGEELPTAECPFPGFEKVVFRCLPQTHKLRLICLHLITSPWFERLVIFVILLNCLTLGMYQPCKDAQGCTDTRCRVLAVLDHVVYGFFVMEMLVKVLAMGFLGKKGYIAETWNRLDMFIIIAGAAEYGLQNGDINLSAIRTIRVLRPLRAINRIPNLRILVMLLLDTLPMLGNVLLICFFVFFIFGILGVQLWAGMLRQRCYMPENMTQLIRNASLLYNISNPIDEYYKGSWSSAEFICSLPEDGGMLTCDQISPSLNKESQECTLPFTTEVLDPDYQNPDNGSCVNYNQYYTVCQPDGPNPFKQSISFDNIASAWIAIFQVISLEGWVDIMYYIQDVHTYWVWVYFLALIVIGSFFMVNLFLVVIATQFSETKRRETEKIAEERKRYKSSTTLTSSRTDSDGCYNQLLKYVIHVVRRYHRQAKRSYKAWREKRRKRNSSESENENDSMADIKLNVFGNHIHCQPCYHVIALMESAPAPIASPEPSDIDSVSYRGLSRYVNSSPRFFRRSARTSPLITLEPHIVITEGQEETSFYTPPPTESSSNNVTCSSQQNGGLKVVVNANEGPENTALLQVLPTHLLERAGVRSVSTSNSRSSSPHPSPMFTRRTDQLPSPHSTAGIEAKNGHHKIWRSRSHDGRIVPTGNHLAVPNTNNNRVVPSPTLPHRLMLPGDSGSCYSIQSRGSSPGPHTPSIIPGELANGGLSQHSSVYSAQLVGDWSFNGGGKIPNGFHQTSLGDGRHRHSFSQLSYLQGGCDLCCHECQHLCTEYQKQGGVRVQEENTVYTRGRKCKEQMMKIRAKMKVIVNGNIFRNSILISILINTVMMGVEHHNQPDLLTDIVEYSNYVFIGIFTIEMIFKIFAEGCLHYVKDAFNVFDGFIVVMSYVEIGMGGENSGLSVLRTFRLLRILKLIRFLPALQRQFVVMVRTLDNVASFFGLLLLFMFIFSVLGMNLFGCMFCEDNSFGERVCERWNFDSLLWSLITVFQILTQEDWNIIMYEGMYKTSPWAALYFVALMTFGNYVLFNLLVAILVEGFSSVRGEASPLDLINAHMKKDEENEEEKQQQQGAGGALPSIITDHAGERQDLRIKMPPIITHTDATPRGSPKSETPMPSPSAHLLSLDDQSDWEIQSNQSFTPYLHSPSLNSHKSNTSTPRLSRKSSNSLKGRRSQRSQDKVSLMEAEFDQENMSNHEDDPIHTSRLTVSSGESRSRNSSIRNFDLLQVPGRKPLQTSSAPESPVSLMSFDMDQTSHSLDRSNNNKLEHHHSLVLGPLSLQIPDHSLVPQTPHKKCNGSINHSPAKLNGGPNASGEHTPLLITSPEHTHRNGHKQNNISPHDLEQQLDSTLNKKLKGKSIHGSVYSRLNEEEEMAKQYPYSDQEKTEGSKPEMDEDEKNILQKLLKCFKPRGCLITRADYSLYLLAPRNPVRRFCKWLSTRKWFDYCILVLIGLNCITLAVERPKIRPDSVEREILTIANYVFTALFFLEMVIKITAKGFVIGKETYLRDGWNIMDCFLVFVSSIDLFISLTLHESPKIFGVLRVLRLLRALRPLRVISRAPGLKLVVETLLSSLRPIGNIVLICLTFFLIFGILGVQLFRGRFYHCDAEVEDLRNVTTKQDCLDRGFEWKNWKYNFDDLGNALMSLFVLSSKDGWVTIMYQGLDAVDVDVQPIQNYAEWRLLYFISFLLLVGFFVLNMFVGVVVENFHKCREAHEKEERQKREARRLRKLAKKISTVDPLAPLMKIVSMEQPAEGAAADDAADEREQKKEKEKVHELNQQPFYTHYGKRRMFVYKLVTNKFFDIAVSLIIFLNVISMAVEHYQMSAEMLFSLKIMNYVFTFIFLLEGIFKIVAYGFVRYIKERWNQLDTLIIILSIIGIILEEVQNDAIPINPTIMRVMRILRIARVLKLLKVAKGIRALLDTVLVALPQVGNLGLLFFLLFFIFAALGVELFGRIECSTNNPCEGMGVHANFENSGSAFLTLFRIATGDNWNGIMKDALRENCDDSVDCEQNCCVNTVITPIYFVVFVLTAQFVLVNVVVAVLMKHLEESSFYNKARKKHMKQLGIDKEKAEQIEADGDGEDEDHNESDRETDSVIEQPENIPSTMYNYSKTKSEHKLYDLIPKHKPLCKHLSLPSNFKVHPSVLESANS